MLGILFNRLGRGGYVFSLLRYMRLVCLCLVGL